MNIIIILKNFENLLDTYVVPEKIQDFLSLLTPADSQLETVTCRQTTYPI